MNKRDVTLICLSRAPIDRLVAYKQRMGWQFPYVSTYGTDFPFDFGLALDRGAGRADPRDPGDGAEPAGVAPVWGSQVGAQLQDGLRENPGYIAFAQENGTVYHTYTVTAPDPFVAPYFIFCSTGRRSRSPTSRSTTARTSTRAEYRGVAGTHRPGGRPSAGARPPGLVGTRTAALPGRTSARSFSSQRQGV